MSKWWSEVFASSADKSRLVAIVISALVAVSVLLLNQYFIRRKARRELLIEKLEELYRTGNRYEKRAWTLLAAINAPLRDEYGNVMIDQSLIEAVNAEVYKMEMLVALYFPTEPFEKDKFFAGNTLPVLSIVIRDKQVTEDQGLTASEETRDNITNNSEAIRELARRLIRRYRH